MQINSVQAYVYDFMKPLGMTVLRNILASGDELGDRFEVRVFCGREPVNLEEARIYAYFIRSADGATVAIEGEASGNLAAVTLPAACYAVPGRFTLTIKAAQNDQRHALFVGEGAVIRSATEQAVDPGEIIPSIDELLAQIAEIEQAASAANAAAADASAAAALIEGMEVTAEAAAEAGAETSREGGALHLKLLLPRGPAGKDGAPGEKGESGERGPAGPQGVPGKDGTGVVIKGSYESEEALKQAHETGEPGDVYMVQGDLYVWSPDNAQWENVGRIQGPEGKEGAKGDPGDQGPTGLSAGFGQVTATVDEYSGTPSVDVMTDGPDTAKNFHFAFHNLRGRDGSGGGGSGGIGMVTATVDDTSGNPQVKVTQSGSDFRLDFTGINGAKGADGQPGEPGPTGANGAPGQDGVTFTPAVDESGLLTWTNDGDRQNPDPVNIKGPKGDGADITVAGVGPDEGGNIPLTASDISALGADETAQAAKKLEMPFSLTLSGAVSGTAQVDGSGDVNMTTSGGSNLVVAAEQPKGNGIIWVKPQNTTETKTEYQANPSGLGLDGTTATCEVEFARNGEAVGGSNVQYGLYAKFYFYDAEKPNTSKINRVIVTMRSKVGGPSYTLLDKDPDVWFGMDATCMLELDTRNEPVTLANVTAADSLVLTFTFYKTGNSKGRQENSVQFLLQATGVSAGSGVQPCELYYIP